MTPDKNQLKRHIHKSDLTAMEKRCLEVLVDAEPVRHGYWKHETKENAWGNMVKIRRCSECGKYSYKNKAFEFDFPNCPCCRAIMDKEESK